MANRTGIEWTNITWNPVTGCTQVSAGCDNCYALTLAHRLLRKHYTKRRPQEDTFANRRDPFAVRLWPERLGEPFSWRGRQRVFVNSMSDLFHADIPDDYVRKVFDVMLRATGTPTRSSRSGRRGWLGSLKGIWTSSRRQSCLDTSGSAPQSRTLTYGIVPITYGSSQQPFAFFHVSH